MNRCAVTLMHESAHEFSLDEKKLQQLLEACLAEDDMDNAQITVLWIDAEECSRLHEEHFNDSSKTDVMSFPAGYPDPSTNRTHLGDLAVCVDVAKELSEQRGVALEDELILYVCHGLLHLLGYDDIEEEDRAEMWAAQRRLLSPLGIEIGPDPQ